MPKARGNSRADSENRAAGYGEFVKKLSGGTERRAAGLCAASSGSAGGSYYGICQAERGRGILKQANSAKDSG